jgi:formamidopyrimidine-DNA glycosylase
VPELPDLTVYLDALAARISGAPCAAVTVVSPFVVRSVDPPVSAIVGKRVTGLSRIGKRLVFAFDDEMFLAIHLMVAGRLQWAVKKPKPNRRLMLALFEFPVGTLVLTEAGTRKRASIHVVRGAAALAEFSRGGIEPLDATLEQFAARVRLENHTLKRTLTDPRPFAGIGNAYSDEILHRARLSPLLLTSRITDEEIARLHAAVRGALEDWTERLRRDTGEQWPAKVTAFRDDMAVHGRYGKPCPTCGGPVQRIRYADNETNYCATCQTGGRLLADRAMSRLLKEDWPRSLEEMEERISGAGETAR